MSEAPGSSRASNPSTRVVETHISRLFFVDDRVYKLKRPVAFPFIDLRTRAAREQLCHREVELNRRLAPDVYLGVADVSGPDGEPCDHLVVMRRLPEERRLSTLVASSDPASEHDLDALAALVARFHASAARSTAISAAGSPDRVLARWQQLFDEVEPFVGPVLDPARVDDVRRLQRAYVDGRHRLFAARIEEGAICDGHGDLQTDDVFCLDDGPRVLDCMEFDDELRHVDVADDLAFLLMDLERLGRPDLAARLLDAYEAARGAALPRSLVAFYVAYRAMVRCMVSCMRTGQITEQARRDEHAARARRLLELCAAELHAATPHLTLVGGLPGTGKTTTALALGAETGGEVLRSDVVRKEMAGLDAATHAPAAYGAGLYTSEATEAVYDELARRARTALELGRSVIVDASFTRDAHRALFRRIALDTASAIDELRCTVDPEVAAERMRRRQQVGADASDATPQIAQAMAQATDPWPESTEVDTGRGEVDAATIIARVGAR